MKTDKELLELAAKAAGYNIKAHEDGTLYSDYRCSGYWGVFNPLNDDGDALRLAVKLGMQVTVDIGVGEVRVAHNLLYSILIESLKGADIYAATRRAIVRAAAAIGESK